MIVIFTVMREENIEILRLPDGGVYTGAVNENGLPQSSDGTCAWGKQAYVGGWIDGKMSGLGTWYESGQVKQKGGTFGSAIKWNFTKFLVDRNGHVVARYSPTTQPEKIEKDIERLLKSQ